MTHPLTTLAIAVRDALNAATFSIGFTAIRAYVPRFDTESNTDVQVQVVPASDAEGESSAGFDSREMVIHVGVFKRLSGPVSEETDEIDAMLDLCEEIRAELNRVRLGENDGAVCSEISHEPIYSVEDIDERRVFLTVLAFTFLVDVEV